MTPTSQSASSFIIDNYADFGSGKESLECTSRAGDEETSEEKLAPFSNLNEDPPIRPFAFVGGADEEEIFNLVVYGLRVDIRPTSVMSSTSLKRSSTESNPSPSPIIHGEAISGDLNKTSEVITRSKMRNSASNLETDTTKDSVIVTRRPNALLKTPNEEHPLLEKAPYKDLISTRKPWTVEDDALLLKGIAKLGRNYEGICNEFLPKRSEIAIKWRYKRFSKEQRGQNVNAPAKKTQPVKVSKLTPATKKPMLTMSPAEPMSRKRKKDELDVIATTTDTSNKRERRNYKAMHEGVASTEMYPVTCGEAKPSRPRRSRPKSVPDKVASNLGCQKWTREQDDLLRQGIERYGNVHRHTVDEFLPTRSVSAVCSRAYKVFKHLLDETSEASEKSKEEWRMRTLEPSDNVLSTPSDEGYLQAGVQKHDCDIERIQQEHLHSQSASTMAASVHDHAIPLDSSKLVKNVPPPERSRRPKWCFEEDTLLENGIRMHGQDFDQIQAIFLPKRSVKALIVRANKMFRHLFLRNP